jgi:putative membrane protein
MMMPWGMFGSGFGALGMLFMLVFWVLVIAGIVLLVKWLADPSRQAGGAGAGESALDILKRRYARGEIDKNEFEVKRRDLS